MGKTTEPRRNAMTEIYAPNDTVAVDYLPGRWIVEAIHPFVSNGTARPIPPTVTLTQTWTDDGAIRTSLVEVYPTRVHLVRKGNLDQDLESAMAALAAAGNDPAARQRVNDLHDAIEMENFSIQLAQSDTPAPVRFAAA